MRTTRAKAAVLLLVALLLGALGIANGVLKATTSLPDDGVFWRNSPAGLRAEMVALDARGRPSGIRPGDILVAVNGEGVLTAAELEGRIEAAGPGAKLRYTLLRAESPQYLEVELQALPQGNLALYSYLSLAGFFSLLVGTIVLLRRPAEGVVLHFYAICLLFFLVYSISYTGRLDRFDWLLFWIDHLAILFLPVAFLHFCLSFPERRLARLRWWLVPALYLPPVLVALAALCGQWLFVASGGDDLLLRVASVLDRWHPLYFALLFGLSFVVLRSSYGRTRSLTARRQMKWLVWGTGAGVLPFLVFYAIPFYAFPQSLGRQPRLAEELAGHLPLAVLPLALAYAVLKHRLMDVELIFRRSLVSLAAMALVVGVCVLVVGLSGSLLSDDDPHRVLIAVLSTLVVVALFTPVKSRLQDLSDRLFYRERYSSRKALLRLSHELNADLDLVRLTERVQEDVMAALALRAMAVFLPEHDGSFGVFTSQGLPPGSEHARLPRGGALVARLIAGQPVNAEAESDTLPEASELNLGHYFPCRVRGELIAVLAVGRRDGLESLDSEEVDLLQAVASQAGTAIVNGRLYQSLREKAEAFERLTEYNENILESIDSGILVLDLDGRIARWNRAMESLYGLRRGEVLGRALAELFPEAFLEALRGSLVPGHNEDIAHIYKLHLPSAHGRSLMVNVSVAPFELGTGERHGSVLIFEDVTARVRLEEQLQHAEKMASIGLLAAGVAHEVNTPLAGISSYTQLLREQIRPEDLRYPLLEKIEKQTFRAAKIVNNLLNFSRSGSAEAELVDVNRVLLDVLSLLEHQLERGHIKVRREFAEPLPRVRGNENRLQQVFFNLVINARDAMPSGGWLTLVTRLEGHDTLVVEVRDTGVGIRREDVKRIYDPFFTTKGIGRGTGLGLSVSYGIVQEHGGGIFVDSTPGVGTTFQVALPAHVAAAVAARR